MKLKKILLLCLSCILGAALLFGCGDEESVPEEPKGEFYGLGEAYNEGLLTTDDILAIKNYSSDEALDEDTAMAIREDMLISMRSAVKPNGEKRYPGIKLDEIRIKSYRGTYNGAVVISITDNRTFYTTEEKHEIIADVEFIYSDPFYMVWKEK